MELIQDYPFYWYFLIGWIVIPLIILPTLFLIDAPYGRFERAGWGPKISKRLGWIIMELPAVLTITCFIVFSDAEKSLTNWVFLGFWLLHYIQRTFIFPFRIPDTGKTMPLMIALFAILFNVGNGYLNGFYLGTIKPDYALDWMTDIRFMLGANLFIIGFFINIQSDTILFNLRKPGETGYKIPEGGLYGLISCPNYFGEMVEWVGWALMTWSLPGLTFALWTIANLLPRAVANHKWYLNKFENYPKQRKAVIPYIL